MDNSRQQVGVDTQGVDVFSITDGKKVTIDHESQRIRNTPDYAKYREDLDEIFDYWKNDPDGRVSLFSTFNKKTNVDEELLSLAATYFGEDKEVLKAVEEDEVEPRQSSQFHSYLDGIKRVISKLDKPKFVLELILGSNYKYIEDEGEPEEKEVHMFVDAKNKGSIIELAIADYLTGVNYSPVSEVESDNGKIIPEPVVSNSDDTTKTVTNEQVDAVTSTVKSDKVEVKSSGADSSPFKAPTREEILQNKPSELKDPSKVVKKVDDDKDKGSKENKKTEPAKNEKKGGDGGDGKENEKSRLKEEIQWFLRQENLKGLTVEQIEWQFLEGNLSSYYKDKDYLNSLMVHRNVWRTEVESFIETIKQDKYFSAKKLIEESAAFLAPYSTEKHQAGEWIVYDKIKYDYDLLPKEVVDEKEVAEGKKGQKDFQIKALEQIFSKIVYSGKWKKGSQDQPELKGSELDKDLDVRLCLWLLERAGFSTNSKAVDVPESLVDGATFDAGSRSGLSIDKSFDWKLEDGQAKRGKKQLGAIFDNHQPQNGLHTSAAYQLNFFLRAAEEMGLFDNEDNDHTKKNQSEYIKLDRKVVDMMVNMSIDEDNGRLVKDIKQFNESDKNLRGLVGRIKTSKFDDLHDFIITVLQSDRNKSLIERDNTKKVYNNILDYPLSDKWLEKFNLIWPDTKNKGKYTGWAYQQKGNIEQTHRIFMVEGSKDKLKSDEELEKEGWLVRFSDKSGKDLRFVVNIPGFEGDFYGGHVAARALGFDGMIKYTPEKASFLINVLKPELSLNKIAGDIKQGQMVRDTLDIKPPNAQELKTTLREMLNTLSPGLADKAQGKLKEYLLLEDKVENDWQQVDKEFVKQELKTWYDKLPANKKPTDLESQNQEFEWLLEYKLVSLKSKLYNEYMELYKKIKDLKSKVK